MKYTIVVFFMLFFTLAKANNYYFSNSIGDDSRSVLQAQDSITPWKSIRKLNSFTNLHPGDSILFKRGETFYGGLIINASGIIGNEIFYGSYGTGPNPTISGFATLSNWKLLNGNIYYTKLDVPGLNMVTINGIVRGMGRYPNTGYLTYTSHSANASISGSSIGIIPFDPSGGEVVIRKERWILDRHTITSRSSNKLNYSTNNNYGNNNLYSPFDGNGYFIQNNLSTLDQDGEWYYDTTANRLYIYSTSNPSTRDIKASSQSQNLYLNYFTNISFNNIDFEGGNLNGAYVIGTSNITFNNCNFKNQGGNAIWGSHLTNITVKNGIIVNSLNNGIWFEQRCNNTTIDGMTISNSGEIAGAAMSGNGNQQGIFIAGNGTTVQNCSVINSGYIGIHFEGNDVLIQHNFIDTFSNIKDDGAGIYTFTGSSIINSNRRIIDNIVLNAIGAFAGAEGYYWEDFGKAAGIYFDDYANHIIMSGNTVANGSWFGVFYHNANNIQLNNNLVYNFDISQLSLSQDINQTIRNNTITGNTFIAKTAIQKTLQVELNTYNDSLRSFGTFNNNIYARPIDDNNTISINKNYSGGNGETNISLATWQSTYHQDLNSSRSFKPVADVERFQLEYNASDSLKKSWLYGNYTNISGQVQSNYLTLLPYTSVFLIQDSIYILPIQLLNVTGKWVKKNPELFWETNISNNSKYFEVQKSINGNNYITIASIPVFAIQSTVYEYNYVDLSIKNSYEYYYRIKEVNIDGNFMYSKVIKLKNPQTQTIDINPNPVTDLLNFTINGLQTNKKLEISIFSAAGQKVKAVVVSTPGYPYSIDVSSLTKGVYFINTKSDFFFDCHKFIKR